MSKKTLLTSIAVAVALISASSQAFESKVNINTVAKVSDIKTVETDHSKVDLPVVDTASVASVSSHGIFSGQSLKIYNVEVVRKEIKSSADVSPMISRGKLYVARGAKPQGGHVFSIASAASTSPFVYAFTKEKTYIKDLSVENKQDGSVSATIVPGMVDEGVTLVVDTKRTKENILISTISLSEKRIGSMNESEEHVSRPDTSVFTASNRVVSHPGETIVIHSPPYKQDGKNFQNEYYLTIR